MVAVSNSSPTLLEILRSVLRRLEDDAQFAPDDPAVIRFKQRILRSIAQLDLQRNSLQAPDVIVLPEPEPQKKDQSSRDSVTILVTRRPDLSSSDDEPSAA